MNESVKRLTQSVSALADGEASELELHRILKALDAEQAIDCTDEQSITGKWSRYNLVSHVMANTPLGGKDIAQSVTNAIAQEKSYKTNFLQPAVQVKSVGRFAVAASVAVMAIVGVQQLNIFSPLQNDSLHVATTLTNKSEQLQRPVYQFPSGFQPVIEARTVNAGGMVKTSQPQTKLIKLFTPSSNNQKSQFDLHIKGEGFQGLSKPINLSQDDLFKDSNDGLPEQ